MQSDVDSYYSRFESDKDTSVTTLVVITEQKRFANSMTNRLKNWEPMSERQMETVRKEFI